MNSSTSLSGKCHVRHEALMFAGIIAQHLPAEMTWEDMEAWRNNPEGLAAVLAGLKSPPVPTGAQAPLHVGSPSRHVIDFHRADGGITKAVPLANRADWNDAARAFQKREDEGSVRPMLEPEGDEHTEASAESVRANPHRKGAELPPEGHENNPPAFYNFRGLCG